LGSGPAAGRDRWGFVAKLREQACRRLIRRLACSRLPARGLEREVAEQAPVAAPPQQRLASAQRQLLAALALNSP
jgi:hypothetical protein